MAIKTKRILEFLSKRDLCRALYDISCQVPYGVKHHLYRIRIKLIHKLYSEYRVNLTYDGIARLVEQEAAARWYELQQKRANYDKIHDQISKRASQGTNITLV